MKTRAAMTLLEISASMAVFAVLMSLVGQGLVMGVQVNRQVSTESELANDADRVLQKIASHLRSADYNWITINEGSVSTYSFSICTGLAATGPVFGHRYTLVHDSDAGTLSATLIEQANGSILQEDIARGLRPADGFRIGQLGTDVLVRGNQLQLSLALQSPLEEGRIATREVTTTIYLRSTIYANTNLTVTHTELAGVHDEEPTMVDPEAEPDEEAPGDAAMVSLGDDTDTTLHTISRRDDLYANNLLIKGSIALPTGSADTIDFNSFSLTANKASNGVEASYTVYRGWVAAENRNNKLAEHEFLLDGWVQGSLTVTVSVATASGVQTTVSKTY